MSKLSERKYSWDDGNDYKIIFLPLFRKVPINFILLGSFTIVEAISLGIISMTYDVDAVLIAVGITTGIVVALTIFAFQVR